MTVGEIGAFTAWLSRFTDKGLSLNDSEAPADKLVLRDREADDRRVCLECRNLAGFSPGSWRCSNWKLAGVGASGLPLDMVLLLQRYDGFSNLSILHEVKGMNGTNFPQMSGYLLAAFRMRLKPSKTVPQVNAAARFRHDGDRRP